jgi:hypothetical protein
VQTLQHKCQLQSQHKDTNTTQNSTNTQTKTLNKQNKYSIAEKSNIKELLGQKSYTLKKHR